MALTFSGLSRTPSVFAEFYLLSHFFGKYILSLETSYTIMRSINLFCTDRNIILFFFFLKKSLLFSVEALVDLVAIDNIKGESRFTLYYNLLSYYYNKRFLINYNVVMNMTTFFIKTVSVTSLFSSADWLEREVWDLFGIFFFGHSDLRRILTDYGFRGFPLRKEYPLSGFLEVRYDYTTKALVMDDIFFLQEFRSFSFLSSWDRV